MKQFSKAILAGAVFLAATAAGATMALADPAYELSVITPVPGSGPSVYRIDVASGQVSEVVGSNFVTTKDPQALPAGSYHLHWISSADGKSYWLYRFEAQTGRAWFFNGTQWTEYPLPK
jgi:hypothetical protein